MDISSRMKGSRFLVVEANAFQRALTSEILRAAGAGVIEPCGDTTEAVEACKLHAPDVVLTDWDLAPLDGVEFTRLIRRGATAIPKDAPVIMVTARKTAGDVQTAQNAGVDEYLVKPFNTDGLMRRLYAVFFKRRSFVESFGYVGPCRRRKLVAEFSGPRRRLFDDETADPDNRPELKLIKVITAQKLADARTLTRNLTSGDRKQIRLLYALSVELEDLIGSLEDPLLASASKSLQTYIQGVGASPRFDNRVVEAHVEAMGHLLDLSRSDDSMRMRVSKALDALVNRKLTLAAS